MFRDFIVRSCRPSVVSVAVLAIAVAVLGLAGDTISIRRGHASDNLERDGVEQEPAAFRLREGERLDDQLGEFREAGERVRFYFADGRSSLVTLENLALERVTRVLDEHPTPRLWAVSGNVTEYRGETFLLLERAVLKAKTAPLAGPRSLSR